MIDYKKKPKPIALKKGESICLTTLKVTRPNS